MDSRNKSASDDFILIHALIVIAVLVTAIHGRASERAPALRLEAPQGAHAPVIPTTPRERSALKNSVNVFSFARPVSNSLPIIVSMLQKIVKTFDK